MNRLQEIVAEKHREIETLRRETSEDDVQRSVQQAPPVRSFSGALRSGHPSVIAEIKRSSPSRGLLAAQLDPASLAGEYVRGGADAISVLTDRRFFNGSSADLVNVRASVHVPVLRKDFVLDPIQIYEARAMGADAVLLIVRILDDRMLRTLGELASKLGMDALVETHDETEIRRAVDAGASIIGVNNRDLTTFHVDLSTSERLRPFIPSDVVAVSESGVMTPDDGARLFHAGFDAILVGEGLIASGDRVESVRKLKDHAGAGSLH